MEFVVSNSGCVVYKDGNTYRLAKEKATWLPVAKFVFLLLTTIPLMAGISQFFRVKDNPDNLLAGFILLGASSVFGLTFYLLHRYHRKLRALPPSTLAVVCIIDLANGHLLDANNHKLDSLNQVSVQRKFQATSSSKKLVLSYSNGTLLIAKGNPFARGTAGLEQFFRSISLMD